MYEVLDIKGSLIYYPYYLLGGMGSSLIHPFGLDPNILGLVNILFHDEKHVLFG